MKKTYSELCDCYTQSFNCLYSQLYSASAVLFPATTLTAYEGEEKSFCEEFLFTDQAYLSNFYIQDANDWEGTFKDYLEQFLETEGNSIEIFKSTFNIRRMIFLTLQPIVIKHLNKQDFFNKKEHKRTLWALSSIIEQLVQHEIDCLPMVQPATA